MHAPSYSTHTTECQKSNLFSFSSAHCSRTTSLPLRSIMQSISCLCPVSPSNIRPLLPRMASSVILNLVDPLSLVLPAEKSFGMLYIYRAVDFSLALYHCSTFRGWSHFQKVSPISMSEILDALGEACIKSLAVCAKMKHQRLSGLSYELILKYCAESYFSQPLLSFPPKAI